MRFFPLVICGYAICAGLSFGVMNADFQYHCHRVFKNICDENQVETDTIIALGIGAVPLGWPTALFVAIAGGHGISFTAAPEKSR